MDKVADKTLDLLRQLAEKLGTTVERLYPYFVRQASLEAWAELIGWSIVGLMLLTGSSILFRMRNRPNFTREGRDVAIGFSVALLVLGIIVLLVTLGSTIPTILNPDPQAIREIIRLVK